jgi:hypothetical protein
MASDSASDTKIGLTTTVTPPPPPATSQLTRGSPATPHSNAKFDQLSTTDWWSKSWWSSCIIEQYDYEKDGVFRRAPRTSLSEVSIVTAVLNLKLVTPGWTIDVQLFDDKQRLTHFEITRDNEGLISMTLACKGYGRQVDEDAFFRNEMSETDCWDFLTALNLNGLVETIANLPIPPWEVA